MKMTFKAFLAASLACLVLTTACSSVGPQKKQNTGAQGVDPTKLYEVDLTKPEGPTLQMLRAAQEKNIDLFKKSFLPTVDLSKFDDKAFQKFRTKVLSAAVTPVPESTQVVSDTEAIVKLRNGRGKEIPLKVQKVDNQWLIAEFKFGNRHNQQGQQ